ncbi:SDR family oxidoreductase [Prochlorococcus marinus]|uniref:SDR family oxidoreductase n=1 Tax=Prochlorococcus marinus TaxID=1219 RepID=UPI0022B5439A|nr:SDR family oxidoreductase [Prochlorococcus marinus]
MNKNLSKSSRFKGLRIAITGATGSLGKSLIQELKKKGAYMVGLTHSKKNHVNSDASAPNEWIYWSCGKEDELSSSLKNIDILILNHGFNPKEIIDFNEINKAIEINALSYWRLIKIFEDLAIDNNEDSTKEIWINTSEAEIQIAFSPVYEITKRLIGELVSLKKSKLSIEKSNYLIIKKLILGPFKSKLNPQGILKPEFVAERIIKKAEKENYLIIVTPNPITYLLMPIIESIRILYSKFIKIIYSN